MRAIRGEWDSYHQPELGDDLLNRAKTHTPFSELVFLPILADNRVNCVCRKRETQGSILINKL